MYLIIIIIYNAQCLDWVDLRKRPAAASITVGTLLTHTHRWTVQSMGFEGLWVLRGWLKIEFKKSQKKSEKIRKNRNYVYIY